MTQSSLYTDADRHPEIRQPEVRLPEDRQSGKLWRMFLAGPVIYIVYFIVVWALAEFGCLAGVQGLRPFGMNPIFMGVVALTLIALLATSYFGVRTFRRWHELRQESPDSVDSVDEDRRFMLFVGMWLTGMHLVVILLTPVPMLLGSDCAWL